MLIEKKSFDKIVISGKEYKDNIFYNCYFNYCDFSNASFTDVKFEDCEFNGCNFSFTNFSNVKLNNVLFKECKLLGIEFSKCNNFALTFNFFNCISCSLLRYLKVSQVYLFRQLDRPVSIAIILLVLIALSLITSYQIPLLSGRTVRTESGLMVCLGLCLIERYG